MWIGCIFSEKEQEGEAPESMCADFDMLDTASAYGQKGTLYQASFVGEVNRHGKVWEMPWHSGTAFAMDEARFVKRVRASPISEMPEVEV